MIQTIRGIPMPDQLLDNYLRNLVNLFFKILPIRENEEQTLLPYMESLQAELLGAKELVALLNHDPLFVSLVSILQYLIDNPESSVRVYKREVFKGISICNKLTKKYAVYQSKEGC